MQNQKGAKEDAKEKGKSFAWWLPQEKGGGRKLMFGEEREGLRGRTPPGLRKELTHRERV